MVNKVILQGRLTADVELKEAGGFNMTEFTVAWSEKYKETEKKCFMRCKAWRSTAEFLKNYFGKGQEIVVEGRLITEEWEKDGQKQSRTLCDVEKVNFCGSKSNNANHQETTKAEGFMPIENVTDDECPFV